MDVGPRIAQLRAAYGISQYALWKRSGIAQGALSQYESGLKTPGIDTIERICNALGISLADFFSDPLPHGTTFELTPEEIELIRYYRLLTPSQRQDTTLILRVLSKEGEPSDIPE